MKAQCLKTWNSPLDRSKPLHLKGKSYSIYNVPATKYGFYSVDCEQSNNRVIIQMGDEDYRFE